MGRGGIEALIGLMDEAFDVASMITHDVYHAGEINHLRSLLSGDDRWRYVQLGFG